MSYNTIAISPHAHEKLVDILTKHCAIPGHPYYIHLINHRWELAWPWGRLDLTQDYLNMIGSPFLTELRPIEEALMIIPSSRTSNPERIWVLYTIKLLPIGYDLNEL